jgi:tripartite-type tricarboxylate transporter receptor subunit TctC
MKERGMTKLWLALVFICGTVQAQSWPSRPVRVIVNVAPGGVADVTARVLGAKLTETLGQPFVVENRAGGDGYIGFEAVARAEPDGSTLSYSPGSSMMIAPHIVKRADLDPVKLLTPVAATGAVSLYVLLHPNVPAQNFREFLAYARANPGKLNYGTPGNGTSPHIATEVFNREAGVKMNHVAYKGAGPALKDLLGGVIDLAFDPGVGIGQAKAGKLRMVAVAGPTRHPDFPDVPTLDENGIKGVDGGPHFGFYAPAGTPREVVERINREVLKVMQDPVVLERFKALAVNLAEPMTPEQFATYVRAQYARYAKLLPELNIGQ